MQIRARGYLSLDDMSRAERTSRPGTAPAWQFSRDARQLLKSAQHAHRVGL